MKRLASIGFSWGHEYGQPPKTPEQLERDMRRVQEILVRIGYGHAFDPKRFYYDFHNVEVGSELFNVLIEELQKDPHLARPGSISIETRYTRKELGSAELLIWGPTNQAIEDDCYDFFAEDEEHRDLYRYCSACGAPHEQIREIVINKARMGKREVSLTYSNEVILSERVGQLLQEQGLTGFELWPVHHYKKAYKGEPTLYQLRVTHVLPPMASPPTEFDPVWTRHCEVCGRTGHYLRREHWWGKIHYYEDTDVYYPRSVLKVVKDFNHTVEWFGDLRVTHRWIIITQRVYRLLLEHKVKNWAAVPVYLAE